MSINNQKYIRIKDWWSHILPPVLIFFYAGINNVPATDNKIIQLTLAIIFISILTAIIGYYINDLFDIKDDLLAGKFNFVAAQTSNFKLLFPLLIITIIFLFYFVLLLLRKTEANREELTRLIRELAISNAKK